MALGGGRAPNPMGSAASPSAGATLRHAVPVGACGTIRNVDRAQAAKFLNVDLAAHEIKRIGNGAEGEDRGEDRENGGAMHDCCWCAWVMIFSSKLVRYSEACFRVLEREKNIWWLRILTVGKDACYSDLVAGG